MIRHILLEKDGVESEKPAAHAHLSHEEKAFDEAVAKSMDEKKIDLSGMNVEEDIKPTIDAENFAKDDLATDTDWHNGSQIDDEEEKKLKNRLRLELSRKMMTKTTNTTRLHFCAENLEKRRNKKGDLMHCPKCGSEESRVVESRDTGDSVRRRRECSECGARYTTYERVERPNLAVLKKDGTRELFDRSKLKRAILFSVGRFLGGDAEVKTQFRELNKKFMITAKMRLKASKLATRS